MRSRSGASRRASGSAAPAYGLKRSYGELQLARRAGYGVQGVFPEPRPSAAGRSDRSAGRSCTRSWSGASRCASGSAAPAYGLKHRSASCSCMRSSPNGSKGILRLRRCAPGDQLHEKLVTDAQDAVGFRGVSSRTSEIVR
jgi:hypothetical protein